MLVAAEASGDALGAGLIDALKLRLGDQTRFVGVGGRQMQARGIVSPFDISPLSVLGVTDALRVYPLARRRALETARLACASRPRAVILIDSWGFTLRVARHIRRLVPNIPLIKYVGPQVWATRPGRARTLARAVDHLLTIHSFDGVYFTRQGLDVTFVGNPVLNRDFSGSDPERLRERLGILPGVPVLLLLPGSRSGEVDRLLDPYEQTLIRLMHKHPDLRVLIALADDVADRVRARVANWRSAVDILEGEASRLAAMRAATVALACSGTVTTELALAGCPMVVTYRMSPLTHQVARALIRTRYITLFNFAAQDFIAPERLQAECNPRVLAGDLDRLLCDADVRECQVQRQSVALEVMRGGITDASGAAADAVIRFLTTRS